MERHHRPHSFRRPSTPCWHGKAADRLGLSGVIQRSDWDSLCDNRHPETQRALTPRQKAERRVGYDFNFHAPKSLSVLYGITPDERVLDAFRESVDATMRDIETEMKTRVRKGGKDEDRTTGNMIWGAFTHFTARPVDGVPDPHLHAHCFVFNTTWDGNENRWKAGQFADLKRDAPYFEAMFHSRLARGLEELGVATRRTKKAWEIEAVPDSAIKKFSRRTARIEEKASEMNISDAKAKGELGARTREKKKKNLTLDELRNEWCSRLLPEESAALRQVEAGIGGDRIMEDKQAAGYAVNYAIDHLFERNSVVGERKILTEALRHSLGIASADAVTREFQRRGLITGNRGGETLATTRAVLEEERNMIDFAREGRGTCHRLGTSDHRFRRDWLNEGQRRAVRHVLDSPDRVILIRGAAGTGKTSMMQEAVEAIVANGKKVLVFAPSADASRGVLRQEGFANADTVARFLCDERLQSEARGQVIWIDEAGLLGTRAMARVFELADRLDARVILSGDRKQHGSVERGAALRLLEEEAGLVPASIKEIKRQRADYKCAVQALSEGRTAAGFRQLDRLGWIREAADPDRYRILAAEYVASVNHGKTALVVSPTHLEGESITDEIRAELRKQGKLGRDQRTFTVLENAHLTAAERSDAINYEAGDVIIFNQNARGYEKGRRITVGQSDLPLDQAERFQVFHPNILSISPGDVLRITQNGKTADGEHRLNNGALFTVKKFDGLGNIVLANGWTISKEWGHIAHGYVVTSHASQGKTVDRVFVGQSSASFPASSREQFYVSISRAKERAVVFCDSKEALLEAVDRSDERLSATEFIAGDRLRERMAMLERTRSIDPMVAENVRQRGREPEGRDHER